MLKPRSNDPSKPTVTYTEWCRAVVQAAGTDSRVNLLFDSTIEEPSELLRDKVRNAFTGDANPHYRSVFARGNPDVISAIAERYGVESPWITCTTGCSSALSIIYRAFLGTGTHVIVERPYFDLFPDLGKNCGAQISYVDRTGPTFELDVSRIVSQIRTDTRLIVVTNLHNPTGAALSDAALTELAIVAERAGVTVVVDEVYADFITDGSRSGAAARLSPALVSTGSLSKVYGLFALRCGWIIAQKAARERIQAVYDRYELGVSKVTHAVAASVFDDMAPFEKHWRDILAANRPLMQQQASILEAEELLAGPVPTFGCMYFPRLLVSHDDMAVADFLWETERLAVAPGSYFGRPGHLRLGFGKNTAHIKDGLDRLRAGLLRYRVQQSV
ncbi:pyridoxal phosphate-dependent aminotransferase [Dyella telluris]|uniref:Pyridoxal phosphate-dependent aminotransferase n=1 Tax=Dyella telluris TaxID=2763498 RepID=A0A7G8Q8R4_9GAMM|nr:pyridoxal phosphate-dependent aminotransferase [Dyella telluris]QNK03172.1 pyridoxal phosphate-dependent aminotransferase [Dyella telluris]